MSTVSRPSRPRLLITGLTATAVLGLGLAACGDGSDSATGSADAATAVADQAGILDGDGRGNARADGAVMQQEPTALPVGELDDAEVESLTYMVQEEKLAHDVYVALGALWDTPTFINITDAETTHTDSVRGLLDRYGIEDPTAGMAEGEFSDPTFTALYQDLVSQGNASQVDALHVGALIEELDISDIEARIAETDEGAITTVYERLLAGSRNHLRAFDNSLGAQGETYSPQYISVDDYEAISSSGVERGGPAN